jgi:hypothetical protein
LKNQANGMTGEGQKNGGGVRETSRLWIEE